MWLQASRYLRQKKTTLPEHMIRQQNRFLPVCCGKHKNMRHLTNKEKLIQAVMPSGCDYGYNRIQPVKILEERNVKNITVEEIYQAVASFEGESADTTDV